MKTKKYILITVAVLLGFILWYLAFAFILLELNPLKWSEASRLPFALFGWVIPTILGFITFFAVEYKN